MALDGLRPDEWIAPSRDLRARLEHWSSLTGIAVEVWALPREPLAGPLTELVQATVLHVLNGFEADGTVRHVGFALTAGARGLRLTISGDGIGLPPGRLVESLRADRARFAELGGRLSVNAVLGGGITVSAALALAGTDRR
ncbi:sensor histidine kinase [Nonomuraea recticatena]|uniref:Histidine kinase/HSP90-like ATPase domain-containing protein n=1 Tax=Nonomuraea recticatena TaxID=46178 RepID=A0ABP6F1G6_9ACTN